MERFHSGKTAFHNCTYPNKSPAEVDVNTKIKDDWYLVVFCLQNACFVYIMKAVATVLSTKPN